MLGTIQADLGDTRRFELNPILAAEKKELAKRAGTSSRLSLNQDPVENSCRLAVDVLLRSVASAFGAGALGGI